MTMKKICSSDLKHCAVCSKKILRWTILGNVFLAGIKLAGGIYANSSGLIADGMQSFSCVGTSILVMVSLVFSQREYNSKFPYGYAKLEFIVALSAFSILIGLGLFIALSSMLGILRRDFFQPDIMALPVVLISAFLTYIMYRYNFCAGTKLDSPGMIANSAHAGADLFSSGAVILGIMLSQLGPEFAICDRIAALFVGIIIIKDSISHWISNLQIIADQEPGPGFRGQIEKIISDIDPDYQPVIIKFKRVGKKFWAGISLKCPMTATVRQTESLTENMRHVIISYVPLINKIDFFIDVC